MSRLVVALIAVGAVVLAVLAAAGVLVFTALNQQRDLAFVPDGAVYVRYEATTADGKPLPEGRLQAIAEALELRLVALGAETAQSGVVDNGVVLTVPSEQRQLLADLGTDLPAAQLRPVLDVVPNTCGTAPLPEKMTLVCPLEGSHGYRLAPPAVTAGDIENAKAAKAPGGNGYLVSVTLTDRGAQTFGQMTTRLAGAEPPANQLAIVAAGVVVSAPEIIEPIPGGEIRISGRFTEDEARRLVGAMLARPDEVTLHRGELAIR